MKVIGEEMVEPNQAAYAAARAKLIALAGGETNILRFKLIEAWDVVRERKLWRLDAFLKVS